MSKYNVKDEVNKSESQMEIKIYMYVCLIRESFKHFPRLLYYFVQYLGTCFIMKFCKNSYIKLYYQLIIEST